MNAKFTSTSRPEGNCFFATPHNLPVNLSSSFEIPKLNPDRERFATVPVLAMLSLLALLPAGDTHAFGQGGATGQGGPASGQSVTEPGSKSPDLSYGKLPLSFEINRGQSDSRVKFLAHGNGYSLFLTDKEAVLAMTGRVPSVREDTRKAGAVGKTAQAAVTNFRTDAVRMQLEGASPNSKISGEEQLPGTVNYFTSNDPSKWRSNLPTYARVKYSEVYPGVDLVYYGNAGSNQGRLEYDFVVAPGASPKPVRLHFAGTRSVRLTTDGGLAIAAKDGEIAFHKPVVYQMKDGQREVVDGRFALLAKNTVGFTLGDYDRGRELVIDPYLAYSTYLGSIGQGINDYIGSGGAIAVDAYGNAYIAGVTAATDFPVTEGAYQTTPGSIFVSKLNTSGSALIYSTYLGIGFNHLGNGFNLVAGIGVNNRSEAYVTGIVSAGTDFPITSEAFQKVNRSGTTIFVTKLNPTGTSLDFSTYLGGSSTDFATSIFVDANDHAYVTGSANSTDFPVTEGAYQKVNRSTVPGWGNAFVTKLNSEGSGLMYSTYLGGSVSNYPGSQSGSYFGDYGASIFVDSKEEAYVTGGASSTDFPVSAEAFQKVNSAYYETGFVAKLNSTGSALLYSTYLGGSFTDDGTGIAADRQGNAYVTGVAFSTDFPVTKGAFQTIDDSYGYVVFVTKLNPTGSALVYSTYLGGLGQPQNESTGAYFGDSPAGIGVDSLGNAYVAGTTYSGNFPIAGNAYQTVNHGNNRGGGESNAFMTKFKPDGSGLIYSSYLGGRGFSASNDGPSVGPIPYGDGVYGMALDRLDSVSLTGYSYSAVFPTTSGAYLRTNPAPSQSTAAWVAKFGLANP
jgi:hypothetical protein